MMLNDEHITIGWRSPFGITPSDGDAVDTVDETPLGVAVVEANVCIWLQFYVFETFAFENISQVGLAAILCIISCQRANSHCQILRFPLI